MRERFRQVRWVAAAACVAAASLTSCGKDGPPPAPAEAASPAPEVQRSYSADCELSGERVRCEVRVFVNKGHATVADRIELALEAIAPAGVRVEWPSVGDSIAEMDVLGVEDRRSLGAAPASLGVTRRVVVMEPFLPGERTLAPMEVRFVDAGGASCVVTTEPVKIVVTSLLEGDGHPDEPELRGVIEPGARRTAWWVWPVAGIALLGVAGLGAMAWRRRGTRTAEPLTPYAAAMKRLKELDESPADAFGGAYTNALGGILKTYIAGAMGVEAKDRTTEELLSEIGDEPTINASSLREVLTRLDQVSFAGASIGAAEAHELKDRVYKLVMGIQAGRTAAEAGGNT